MRGIPGRPGEQSEHSALSRTRQGAPGGLRTLHAEGDEPTWSTDTMITQLCGAISPRASRGVVPGGRLLACVPLCAAP